MADEREGFKFTPRSSDGNVVIRKTDNKLAGPLDITTKGIRGTGLNEGFLNLAFPGRQAFFGKDDTALVAQFERWVGADTSDEAVEERTIAMERIGISNYSDWAEFGATPDLRANWRFGYGLGPEEGEPDPSLIDSPFVPSPTSPVLGDDGRPVSPSIEDGYGRAQMPSDTTWGSDIEQRNANNFKPGFSEEGPNDTRKRVVRLFKRSAEGALTNE